MLFILGPCAIESEEVTLATAHYLAAFQKGLQENGFPEVEIVFKSSYSKANRTSGDAFRGVGIVEGRRILQRVKAETGLRVTTDVHSVEDIHYLTGVVDLFQIPHSLSRYTEIIEAAARSGAQVSIKKGLFLSPEEANKSVDKAINAGAPLPVILIERGSCFGYNDYVVDMRAFSRMNRDGVVTCIDCTHSGKNRKYAIAIASAAIAAGAQAVFAEVHPDPDNALCDGPCMLELADLGRLFLNTKTISDALKMVNTDDME